MTIEELKEQLSQIVEMQEPNHDVDGNHRYADRLLLEYINDESVSKLFDAINKWYA